MRSEVYKVVYGKTPVNKGPVYFEQFNTFAEAALFAVQQEFIFEIKYYDTKTNNLQDESHNFG